MSERNVLAGRYELIEKIGDGGMAIVYKAKDRLLKRFIAVKILKPEFVQDIKFVENFRKESHAAASLSHPNIVSIYDVGQEGNINYIVMELVSGKTLNELIKEEAPMDYRKAADIAKQVAAGLSAAHKKGIVHRDVKPHNILMTEDGIAKITDFGIAKAVTNTTIVDSGKDNVMGSVHYFSPEQAKGANVDEKSDIYSLGIVLYEMLTGKVPFDGDNPVTIALMQINEPVTPPSVFNHNVPPGLERIVMKAVEKQPKNRFDSADEMIDALDKMEVVNRVVGDSIYDGAEELNEAYDNYDNYDTYSFGREELNKEAGRNKKSKGKGSKNKKKIAIIAAAVIVALAALVGIGFATGLFDKKDIEVPDFRGMTIEEAEDKAEDLGIEVKIGKYEFSTEYEQDQIMDQDPNHGEMVAKGDTVTVDISKGGERGVIPNLIGKSEEDAKKMIEDYGFELGTVKEKESHEEKGTVIEQDPSAGSEGKQGDTINITISDGSGKEMGEVPYVLGMSEDEARAAIEEAGFKVGDISEGVSSAYDNGQVMWQEYDAGTSVEKGTAIDIRISGGQTSTKTIEVPLSQAKNDTTTLTIVVTDESGNVIWRDKVSNVDSSDKYSNYPVNVIGKGRCTVRVYFDSDPEPIVQKIDF
ncbi:Stk1 family PASTA domain-containing Ser/Thr kinase [Gallibacter intestinalis]|uniref:non-specific serine/threonine protein kinase n=1 Tax=Gallibacter intestinalis TaxID=2779356 RepID=A0ABR9QVL8_9FIRM|nr:Stk1 family PASTA domain-containing Ser/Thr kinase [Gallibacter intestinalis]MBE5034919.1 Stk1 family PASTA domain-containing Ser/Thr kinase [Gallibacter intestinalis]